MTSWSANVADVRAAIRRTAPSLRADRLVELPHPGWGGDSDAWLVDDRWIFRFPRSPEVAQGLAVEVCLLPRLSPRLPLAIPEFVYVVRDEASAPRFVGYPAIPGEPLRRATLAALPAPRVERVAERLGHFLRALHETPVDEARACGVAEPAASPRALAEAARQRVASLVYPRLTPAERAWVERRFDTFLATPRVTDFVPRLCHGDLSADHLLFDPARGELTGVIDWGDVTIGDPAGEFTWREDYGEEFYRKVVAAYGRADASFDARVTFRIDCLPLAQIAYGVETGSLVEVAEGQHELRRRMSRSAAS